MEFSYFTTRIDVKRNSFCADNLLTPLRWLVNGKRYQIVLLEDDEIAVLGCSTLSKCQRVAQVIFGLLGTLILFPLVLIGLAIKASTTNEESKYFYSIIKSRRDSPETATPILIQDQLSCVPKPVREVLDVQEEISIDRLSDIWNEVGKDHKDCKTVGRELEEWVEKVKDPKKYNFIAEKDVPQAAKRLQNFLKLIIKEYDSGKVSNNKMERILLALIDTSSVCSPTWIEVASGEYKDLKGAGGPEQEILRYVQVIKENLILEKAKELVPGSQWHTMNYVRRLIGKECGLDTSNLDFDQAVQAQEDPNFTKERCLQLFYQTYTAEVLIESLMNKINKEYEGNYPQKLSPLLEKAGIRLAKSEGIDTESEDYDEAIDVLDRFFGGSKGKNDINREGAIELLREVGLIQI